jgi:hypothetical protein
MAVRHGTRKRYGAGCRCDDCRAAQRLYQRRYRERVALGETRPVSVAPVLQVVKIHHPPADAGPVELAVEAELAGVAVAELRPALVAVARAMARILDSSRVPTPQPAAAKVLVSVMDTLHKSAQSRRGNLAAVKSMTERGNHG